MTPAPYTEDTLVQQTTADYLEQQLGWESVYAHNHEDFGPSTLLGRTSERDVVLAGPMRDRLAALNPGLPGEAYDAAVRRIVATAASQTIVAANREKSDLLRDGVQITYRDARGRPTQRRLRLVDFDDPDNNHFLCVREMWVRGDLYRRRPDIVGFVNGLPLLFIECKNIHRDLKAAVEKNYVDYRDTVPHLFHHNAVVMFGNGEKARIGSITCLWGHFHERKRLAEEEPGAVDMETLLKGVCDKRNFLDLVENFILFDESSGETRKILARNHQFLGVNRAVEAVRERKVRAGKLGVFGHTQGAGKSYSMVMFTRKVRRKLGGNFTFLVLTDRDDLETQIYKTFAGCGVVDHDRDPCRASRGDHLGRLLAEHKSHVFSLIDPARPDEELLADLAEAIAMVRSFLQDGGAPLDDVIRKLSFHRNAAIVACKEVANENDETRKRFEVLCREVFKKFKACINIPGVNAHRADRDAIDVIYRSRQGDREKADISDIIRILQGVVDEAIGLRGNRVGDREPYDISAIDFDRLNREFERSRSQRTAVQALKHTVEERLRRLLARNPLRTDFQQHYEHVVAEYNREKDRVTIERTFEELLKFFEELEEEESRAVREGLDEESLAIFDLLKKPDLDKADIQRIKTVWKELLRTLKAEKLRVDQWRNKEATRSAVHVAIRDFLYSDQTGLPAGAYSDEDVTTTTEAVFAHVYRAYSDPAIAVLRRCGGSLSAAQHPLGPESGAGVEAGVRAGVEGIGPESAGKQ